VYQTHFYNLINKFQASVIQTNITHHCSTVLSIPLRNKILSKKQYKIETVHYKEVEKILLFNHFDDNKCCDLFYNVLSNSVPLVTYIKTISNRHKRLKE